MIKGAFLFLMSVVLMYAAFYSWHIIVDNVWVWARFPTVMLLSVLALVHVFLFLIHIHLVVKGRS